MAQLAPLFRQQFFDDNGEPLVGGKIYTYQAGTSTPLATYTDSTETQENENPIILNANGEADIWLGNSAYKFVITDANDVPIRTRDGVALIDDEGVTTAKLAPLSVTTGKLADGAVTTDKLNTAAVTTLKINDLAVTTGKINNGAVTADKLASESVTPAKLSQSIFSDVFTERNKIINGDMNIWQIDNTFVDVASGDYTADRWRFTRAGLMKYDIAQSGIEIPSFSDANYMFRQSMRVKCDTPGGDVAASDIVEISQSIEGTYCRDIIMKSFVFSFWIKSNKAFKFCVAFRNSNFSSSFAPPTKSYVAEVDINAVDTWEKKTIVVPAPTDGDWNIDTKPGITASFVLTCGSDFHTTPGAWQNGKYAGTANMGTFSDSSSNQLFITGVRLEQGTIPRQYESIDPDREMMLCQRYLERVDGIFHGYNPSVNATGAIGGIIPFRVSKPSVPSIEYESTPLLTNVSAAGSVAYLTGVLFLGNYASGSAGPASFSMYAFARSEIDLP